MTALQEPRIPQSEHLKILLFLCQLVNLTHLAESDPFRFLRHRN
jgi:hypothetical protein